MMKGYIFGMVMDLFREWLRCTTRPQMFDENKVSVCTYNYGSETTGFAGQVIRVRGLSAKN